jgi:hypothetical protein
MDELCRLHPWPRLLCDVRCVNCGLACSTHGREKPYPGCRNFVSKRPLANNEVADASMTAEEYAQWKDFVSRCRRIGGRLA